MRNLKHCINGWHTFVSMFRVAASPTRQLAFSAVVAILALGIGVINASSVVQIQAQGGEAVIVGYQLVASSDLSPICVGEIKRAEVAIFALVQVPGDPQTGRVAVPVSASSGNPAIVDTYPGAVLPRQTFYFQGKSPGSTSVFLTPEARRNASLDPSAELSQFSWTIDVIACQYKVDIVSRWETTIDGANVLLTIQAHDVPLMASSDRQVFTTRRFPVAVKWDATVNRVRGCRPDNEAYSPPVPAASIEGQILEGEFILYVRINELEVGGVLFECNGFLLTTGRVRSCNDYLDGLCERRMPNPRFTPLSPNVSFPLNGGTRTVPQTLIHSQGRVEGNATITLSTNNAAPR